MGGGNKNGKRFRGKKKKKKKGWDQVKEADFLRRE